MLLSGAPCTALRAARSKGGRSLPVRCPSTLRRRRKMKTASARKMMVYMSTSFRFLVLAGNGSGGRTFPLRGTAEHYIIDSSLEDVGTKFCQANGTGYFEL